MTVYLTGKLAKALCRRRGFMNEPDRRRLVAAGPAREEFQRHRVVESGILRLVDETHAAIHGAPFVKETSHAE